MAEVLCEGAEVSSVTTSSICETSSIPPATSEVEIRRLRFADRTGSIGSETEPTSKRRKTKSSPVTRRDQGPVGLVGSDQKPIDPKGNMVRLDCVGECPRYGTMSVCGRRRDMEDAVSIRPDFIQNRHFFGVFDGHGCSHVCQIAFLFVLISSSKI
jgi:protein phosphatase 2C